MTNRIGQTRIECERIQNGGLWEKQHDREATIVDSVNIKLNQVDTINYVGEALSSRGGSEKAGRARVNIM